MSLLTRYLVREFIRLFSLCVAGGTVLYLVIDLFDRMTIFVRHHATASWIALFLFYKIPLIIYQVVPAAMLLGVLLSLGLMSRSNEVLALRTSGIPVLRIAYPFVLIAIVVGLGSFFFYDIVVCPTYQKCEHMSRHLLEGKIPFKWFVGGKYWYKGESSVFEISAFRWEKEELVGITAFKIERPFRVSQRIDAESATWDGQRWTFHNVVMRTFGPDHDVVTTRAEEATLPFLETPADFQALAKDEEELPFSEVVTAMKEMEAQGYDATPYRVEMYKKLAFPALNVITALLGIPFALRLPRTGGLATAVVISLVLGFLYWVLFAVTVSFGVSGILPPLLSAWAANILFLALGIYLMLRVEEKALY